MAKEEPFQFAIPGLSEREEDVTDLFVERMHEIAQEEGRRLDVLMDGAPVLIGLVREHLPDYSREQTVAFVMKVIDALGGVLELNKKEPEGNA